MITLQDTIARMKRGIIEDIAELLVPVNVKDFSELHDFVDANEYGGFCEDETIAEIESMFGGPDADGGMAQGAVDYMNAAQNEVSKWIASGGCIDQFSFYRGAERYRVAPLIRKVKHQERTLHELKRYLIDTRLMLERMAREGQDRSTDVHSLLSQIRDVLAVLPRQGSELLKGN